MQLKLLLQTSLAAIPLLTLNNNTLAQGTPPAASVTVKIDVPENLRNAPFNVDRFAVVPPNFKLEVFARVSGVRFMATAPNGDLFVSMPWDGKIKVIQSNPSGGATKDFDYATGLQRPHDIVFHKIGETQYVYIAEKNQIIRYTYTNGDTQAKNKEVIVANLPDDSWPELKGNYGHVLKNIALDRNNKLYVSIASTCNACVEDTQSNPKRGAIYVYDADGKNGRLFAEGIRNAEGLDFVPGTNDLWVVINGRDQTPYPHDDNSGNYGKVIQSYVDENPPEAFTRVRDGGNYGWPFCNPDGSKSMTNMPFVKDYNTNRSGQVDCNGMDRLSKGIPAHTAPLGLLFTQNTQMPQLYRNGAIVALHGSWNRSKKNGYKVIYFPWQNNEPGDPIDLVSGFLNSDSTESYARPVDIAISQQGDLYISDDHAHTIYKLSYTGPLSAAKHQELERAVNVYPVPAKGNLNIQVKDLKSRELQFVLTNAQSANVLNVKRTVQAGENSLVLDTSGLANGVYFLSIIDGDARVVKRVVLLEK
jgi:glucose/arabinose dehydrogenase